MDIIPGAADDISGRQAAGKGRRMVSPSGSDPAMTAIITATPRVDGKEMIIVRLHTTITMIGTNPVGEWRSSRPA
jgi:hypothetical protein